MNTQQRNQLKKIAGQQHRELSDNYYIHKLMDKETFDQLHGKLWDDLETAIKA